ncbi:AraC family transcriptional regulator [Paenibacillus eucommiae]|uniref:YesN/AraC family two-component response regulator n=1 Tax=Paenibacillus eucommiae TaxID=1355755 RepID=A0ABS4J124_9BACL|nr:AraC family transcriptional regulator [Paenibacillus eucommiae]MBP1993528.1 YesN/AraC family two-component response regulator [Paenibacillus eucommiae]
MDVVQRNLFIQYFSNMKIHISVVANTKAPLTWREINFTPDYARFYFIRHGEGVIKIQNKLYYPQPGQLYLLPSSVEQSYWAVNDNTFYKYWSHFTLKVGETDLFQLLKLPYMVEVDDTDRLEVLFERLITEYQSTELSAILKMNSLFLNILSYYLDACEQKNLLFYSDSINRLEIVLQYIENHLSENLSLDTLAKLVHLHPNYFIHFFKSIIGLTPIQYTNKIRIEKAKQLLLTTNRTVTEIADEVGCQLIYFSRLFKQQTGAAPSEYRSLSLIKKT